jgi:hypothetical protein
MVVIKPTGLKDQDGIALRQAQAVYQNTKRNPSQTNTHQRRAEFATDGRLVSINKATARNYFYRNADSPFTGRRLIRGY